MFIGKQGAWALSADGRKWYRKKRNIARIVVVLIWLVSSAVIFEMYESIERTVLWSEISMACAALLIFSFIVSYTCWVAKTKQYVKSRFVWLLAVFLGFLVLYIILMLGLALLDIAAGPVTKQITVADRWDPKRGGDNITTTDGGRYELFSEKVEMRIGGTYKVMIFRYSRKVVGLEQVAP
ncbi:hypothetical protein FE781_07795 [Paenibacillus thermoaerophilus]|nr:hypothetical protein FE781_07795 [Paenibacillus thermoaerophilus]